MPIKVPNNLPAVKTLTEENVFVDDGYPGNEPGYQTPSDFDPESDAHQDRHGDPADQTAGNTPLQVELELLQVSSHKSKRTPQRST